MRAGQPRRGRCILRLQHLDFHFHFHFHLLSWLSPVLQSELQAYAALTSRRSMAG